MTNQNNFLFRISQCGRFSLLELLQDVVNLIGLALPVGKEGDACWGEGGELGKEAALVGRVLLRGDAVASKDKDGSIM